METVTFIGRKSTEGFTTTTILLSHGVLFDTWQVLLLHFPTCCDLLASESSSEIQCFFIHVHGRMCPWWCCWSGFRVAIGDVAPFTPCAKAHLVTGLGDTGTGLPWAEDCHSPVLFSPRSCLWADQVTKGGKLKPNKSTKPSAPPQWLQREKNFTSEARTIISWMLYSHVSSHSRHILTFKLVVNKILDNQLIYTQYFSASKCPAITAQCW